MAKEDRSYPPWWEVHYEWEWNDLTLVQGEWEFQVMGSNEWFVFDRFVINHQQRVQWVDGFYKGEFGGYISYYPARVTAARPIVKGKARGRPKRNTPVAETAE